MLNIPSLLERLLQNNYSEKNIFIPISILVIVILSVLKIDIEIIKNSQYIIPLLIIINTLLTILIVPFISGKFKKILENIYNLKSLENNLITLMEKYNEINEEINYIKKKSINIENTVKDTNSCFKGVPNVKILNNILQLRTKELWAEIFKQYLQALVLYKSETTHVLLENTQNNISDIVKNYLSFYKEAISQYHLDSRILDDLNAIIKEGINLSLVELEKRKKVDERLFVISSLLKHMCDDLDKTTVNYLQKLQLQLY
jgi:hypothetical protein